MITVKRELVLPQDFHPSDMYRIASCGMDNTVKIWSMKGMEHLLIAFVILKGKRQLMLIVTFTLVLL